MHCLWVWQRGRNLQWNCDSWSWPAPFKELYGRSKQNSRRHSLRIYSWMLKRRWLAGMEPPNSCLVLLDKEWILNMLYITQHPIFQSSRLGGRVVNLLISLQSVCLMWMEEQVTKASINTRVCLVGMEEQVTKIGTNTTATINYDIRIADKLQLLLRLKSSSALIMETFRTTLEFGSVNLDR